MLVLGNFLIALASVVSAVLTFVWGLLLARILFSWLRPNPQAGILRSLVQGVYQLTDPVLDRTRRLFPFLLVGALDLSPLVLFLAVGFLNRFVATSLFELGQSML